MKRVSFKVAKAIKDAGYPQNLTNSHYTNCGELVCYGIAGEMGFDIPTYLEVWLWLWREKHIRFDVEDLWDAKLSYPERGCASNTNQLGGICTPEVSDPEEAIIAAIEYLVDNKLLK